MTTIEQVRQQIAELKARPPVEKTPAVNRVVARRSATPTPTPDPEPCEKCEKHVSGVCWDCAVIRGYGLLSGLLSADTYRSIFGSNPNPPSDPVPNGKPTVTPTGLIYRTVASWSGIDHNDVIDRVIDVAAAWLFRGGDPDRLQSKIGKWSRHAAERTPTGRGSIELAKPQPPTPLPVTVHNVLLDPGTGRTQPIPAGFVQVVSRQLRQPVVTVRPQTDLEIAKLDPGKHLRQERTFSFSSWVSPDSETNPISAAHNPRPIAGGGLVTLFPRWIHNESGLPLSKTDLDLIGFGVDCVRHVRFAWKEALGRDLTRKEAMAIRRDLVRVVESATLTYSTEHNAPTLTDSKNPVRVATPIARKSLPIVWGSTPFAPLPDLDPVAGVVGCGHGPEKGCPRDCETRLERDRVWELRKLDPVASGHVTPKTPLETALLRVAALDRDTIQTDLLTYRLAT